ncbi:hypothetical protein CCZ01_01010 [Helicobacter monodelphidis]|uniref:TRL-like family protein n=1 Tax=Helicobacter sp. 15-1451 TaxID=2004995 RepID=UPI000DCC11C7|nr:TRL-like family protein [Helicobacter sp. 15-1451]RAX58806.1 hypothetical protein CCZ01_01010 [Helicobacter sp. 15-1451]
MLKILMSLGLGFALMVGLTGCGVGAVMTGDPVFGVVYADVNAPTKGAIGEGGAMTKVGEASCESILSLVAKGDCSVAAAAKNGGITQVSAVDHHTMSILGIYVKYTTKVSGK